MTRRAARRSPSELRRRGIVARALTPLSWAWARVGPRPAAWRALALPWPIAILSGLLVRAGFPPFDRVGLAFAGLVLFLFYLGKNRRYLDARTGFWFGALWGFVYYYASCSWLNTLYVFNALAPVGVVIVGCVLAFWGGVFGAGAGWIARHRPAALPLFAACWWTLVEWFRSRGTLAFPFFWIGHLGAAHPQYVFKVGVELYSFLGVFGAAVVACAMCRWWAIAGFDDRAAGRAVAIQVALVALAVSPAFLWLPRDFPSAASTAAAPTLRFAAVQPNIDQMRKVVAWTSPGEGERIRVDTMRVADGIAPGEVDLILLPEATFPGWQGSIFEQPELASTTLRYARRTRASVVVGDTNYRLIERPGGKAVDVEFFNSCWLVAPGDTAFPRDRVYEKQQLVAFGECVPYVGWIPGMKGLVGVFDFTPAASARNLPLPAGARLGAVICFESAMSNLIFARARDGANAIAVITNDSWFGASSGLDYHFTQAVFRAFETGLPVIQAANTGVTGFVDPATRRVVRIAPLAAGILRGEVPLPSHPPGHLGHWRTGFFALLVLGTLVPMLLRRSTPASPRP